MPDRVTFDHAALWGLRFAVPDGPIAADLGDGPAVTVHLLPSTVECERVVFAADGVTMDNEGYWVDLDRLRTEDDWVQHLAEKPPRQGYQPAVVMLADALARKKLEGRQ